MRVVWVVALVTGLARNAPAEAKCPADQPIPWTGGVCLGRMEAYIRCTERFFPKTISATEKKNIDAKLQAGFRGLVVEGSGDAQAKVHVEKATEEALKGTAYEGLAKKIADQCRDMALQSSEGSKKPTSCDAKIEAPISQGTTGPIEVTDGFGVVAGLARPIPANRAFFVLHEKREDEVRHWYKGQLTVKGTKAEGKVKHLRGEPKEVFTLKVVAVDAAGREMIRKVREKGRKEKVWDELIGIDAHFVECASFDVTKKE